METGLCAWVQIHPNADPSPGWPGVSLSSLALPITPSWGLLHRGSSGTFDLVKEHPPFPQDKAQKCLSWFWFPFFTPP